MNGIIESVGSSNSLFLQDRQTILIMAKKSSNTKQTSSGGFDFEDRVASLIQRNSRVASTVLLEACLGVGRIKKD